MKHGFKASARRLALEVRQELDLGIESRLDPYQLAELYGIRVIRLSDLDCSEAYAHFSQVRPDVFSGAVLPMGSAIVMIENDAHLEVRRRSTVSHEMSHVILEHPFEAAVVGIDDCRSSNSGDHEDEATWLAGELLIPSDTARRLGIAGASDQDVAEQFDVSVDMARWRMNVSGGRQIRRRRNQPN